MKGRDKKPALEIFEQVANACGGVLSEIAANLNVSRATVYNWCKSDEGFAEAFEDSASRF